MTEKLPGSFPAKAIIAGCFGTLLFAFAIANTSSAQMSPDEAIERLHDRQATQTTQPSAEDVAELKQIIRELNTENVRLRAQVENFKRIVPAPPQTGWGISRMENAAYAHVCNTDCVFNVGLDGSLTAGTPGQRVVLTSDQVGMPLQRADGTVINTLTHQHRRLSQLALYNVFINNNTPYDPTLDAQANIRRMTDAYLVLVNVDNGFIDLVAKDDRIWGAALRQNVHQETTIVLEKTIVVSETTTTGN